ncbi:MAG: Bax inhibitor-1/YccA family protein [Polyangiaceae bacterium]|nr:Bax inhibitor-1/YccA family protein [Polyangiaceae bacterium]
MNSMNYAGRRVAARPTEIISDGLWVTYRWMSAGLALTGLVALLIAHSPAAIDLLLGNRFVFYALLFAQLGFVLAFGAVAPRVGTGTAAAMFFGYAALTGITFAAVFLVYTATSIASTFFVTAGTFAGLSIYGSVTHRDLSTVGRFALFALIGVILASIANFFLRSSGLEWAITFIGVLLFAGLTAYDTQRLKRLFAEGSASPNLPLIGALTLYLDFINMFLFLLRIMGTRRRG